MTLWQSLGLISPTQWAYAAGLLALFVWRGPSLVAWVLLGDFLAILAIAGAMDFGIIGTEDARWHMLVVWVATAAILATQPGIARVIAAISAGTVAVFVACLILPVQFATTSAIVNICSFAALGVAAIGMGGDSGGRRRYPDRPLSVGLSAGNTGMASGGVARGADVLSQDLGGLN